MTLKSKDDVELTYSRTWEEIENMLEKAEKTLHHHEVKMTEAPPKAKGGRITLVISKPFKALSRHFVGLLAIDK